MSKLYVALGDSISIDDYSGGAGCGGPSLLFSNRDVDFPDWAGRDLRSRGFDYILNLAQDGAMAEHVEDQVEELFRVGARPQLATVTFGGNDLIRVINGADADATLADVEKRGAALLTRLNRLFPSCQLVVGTIYDPTDGTGRSGGWLPDWLKGVTVLAAFNAMLGDLAARHRAKVADIHGRFLGHGVTVGDVGQPDARPENRDLYYTRVIEPNAWGASEVRAAFWEAIQ